jgi:dihydropteroate synthase
LIMGVLNVTPDSFSDGGLYLSLDAAVDQARRMKAEGADLIDIGGESTRPGAQPVTAQEELRRVLPVLEALAGLEIPLSIDTRRPEVMRAALAAGADLINDVEALKSPEALPLVVDSGCAICLMHMQGDPRTMQDAPQYQDVFAEVSRFLNERTELLLHAGVSAQRILIDPGFGFGKTLAQNLELLVRLGELSQSVAGLPVLAGLSRKSMIGALTGKGADDRVAGSVAAALGAVVRGAAIVRVHDVAATRDAMAVWQAIEDFKVPGLNGGRNRATHQTGAT